MSSPDYTNIMVLKTTAAKVEKIKNMIADDLEKATGHRIKVTTSIMVEALIQAYVNGKKESKK